jgi:amino acid permease
LAKAPAIRGPRRRARHKRQQSGFKGTLFDRVETLDTILATAEKKSLTRMHGAFRLAMLGTGGTIGTGIFVLTAEAAQIAGEIVSGVRWRRGLG